MKTEVIKIELAIIKNNKMCTKKYYCNEIVDWLALIGWLK